MTNFKIQETNEIKSMAADKDVLLSYTSLPYDADDDAFVISSDDFDWWQEYFSSRENDREKFAQLKERYGERAVEIYEKNAFLFEGDLEDEHAAWQTIFQEIETA